MSAFEQGDILKVSGINVPVIVVTKDVYNETGKAIVCPIEKTIIPSAVTHVLAGTGTVLCDQVRYLDLRSRSFGKRGHVSIDSIVEISNILESLFDYY